MKKLTRLFRVSFGMRVVIGLKLSPLALYGDGVDLDVQNDEAPQLIELVVHPELFRF